MGSMGRKKDHRLEHRESRHEAGGGRHPRFGRRSRPKTSTEGWAGGSTPTSGSTTASAWSSSRHRAPGRHTVRHKGYVGRVRLGTKPISGGLRHRACARPARRWRCQCQRSFSSRGARRAISARGLKRSPERPFSRSPQLPLLRRVPRPGRQQPAAAGGHDSGARAR